MKYMQAWEEREIEKKRGQSGGTGRRNPCVDQGLQGVWSFPEDTSGRLMEEFSLTEEETGNYLRKYWNKE